MNKVILMGRLTADPDVRETANTKVARYRLAVDRRFKREGDPTADFISCVVFGKGAEFAEKYLKKGTKIAVTGHIQTGSYSKQDGTKVYTTDVIIDEQEFAESKGSGNSAPVAQEHDSPSTDFLNVPDSIDDELPFA